MSIHKKALFQVVRSFFIKGFLESFFLGLLFSPDFTFFVFEMMREGTTLRVDDTADASILTTEG